MTKLELIERLNKINESSQVEGYERIAVVKDWENYGKSRTYFTIEETRINSKKFAKKDYGFYDNIKNEYVPGKCDLSSNTVYNMSGVKVQF